VVDLTSTGLWSRCRQKAEKDSSAQEMAQVEGHDSHECLAELLKASDERKLNPILEGANLGGSSRI
jgi:hypothetical protein